MPTEYNESPFCIAPFKVLQDHDLSSSAKILFLFIYNFAKSKKGCWATNKYFRKVMKLKDDSLFRLMNELEYAKLIGRPYKYDKKRHRVIFVNSDKFPRVQEWYNYTTDHIDGNIPPDFSVQIQNIEKQIANISSHISSISKKIFPDKEVSDKSYALYNNKNNLVSTYSTYRQKALPVAETKEDYEINKLVEKYRREIVKHTYGSKRLTTGIYYLKRRYRQINKRLENKGIVIKRRKYSSRKYTLAYKQIDHAIDVYSKFLKRTDTIIAKIRVKKSPFKVGLDEFFVWSKGTLLHIENSTGLTERFKGMPCWFDLCNQYEANLSSLFGLLKKNKYPEETDYLIEIWQEYSKEVPEDYTASEKNAFINFTDKYLAWYNRNRDKLYFPGNYNDEFPHLTLKFFVKFLSTTRKLNIYTLYSEWIWPAFTNYCKEMKWLRR